MSSEGSGDEDVDHGQDSYDGSFIDDRINPTVATTQAAECDMMAIYRYVNVPLNSNSLNFLSQCDIIWHERLFWSL